MRGDRRARRFFYLRFSLTRRKMCTFCAAYQDFINQSITYGKQQITLNFAMDIIVASTIKINPSIAQKVRFFLTMNLLHILVYR